MATTLTFHGRFVSPTTPTRPAYAEMNTNGVGAAVQAAHGLIPIDANTQEMVPFTMSSGVYDQWIGWRSGRVLSDVTLTNDFTMHLYGRSTIAGSGRLKVQLFKATTNGVETLLGEATAATALTSTNTLYTMTLTLLQPNQALGYGERLICRLYALKETADFDTATHVASMDGAAANTRLVFVETITFHPDNVKFVLRRTSDNGIGTFFDLVPTRGVSAPTTGVVNTVASGTEIQWTRTAGGTLLEWVTPRFKSPWAFADTTQVGSGVGATSTFFMSESNTAANAGYRAKLFRRTPDGTETLCYTFSGTAELSTTLSSASLNPAFGTATLVAPVDFAEDDRLVLRVYIIAAGGTMGSGRTATISYDSSSGSYNDAITLFDTTELKAESDPAQEFIVPSGQSMSGLGNGQ